MHGLARSVRHEWVPPELARILVSDVREVVALLCNEVLDVACSVVSSSCNEEINVTRLLAGR